MGNRELKQTFKEFLISWTNQFPLDYWYRKKYKIPFGSPQHRAANYLDIKFEYEEERMVEEYFKSKRREELALDLYQIDGNVLKPETFKKLSEQEMIELYNSVDDLSRYDDKPEPKPDGKPKETK